MIGIFPTPYPDELLFSVFARYKKWMGYRHDNAVWNDLFMRARQEIPVLFHGDLTPLEKTVPTAWRPDLKELVEKHTLGPFLSLFLTRTKRLEHESPHIIKRGQQIECLEKSRRRLGLFACPLCVENDIETYGEPYWHRVHQVPGVFICPTHRVFLQAIAFPPEKGGNTLILPEQPVRDWGATQIDDSQPDHRLLMKLASDCHLLLQSDCRSVDPEALLALLRKAIKERGLMYKGNNADIAGTDRLITDSYSPELLGALGITIQRNGFHASWIAHIRMRYPQGIALGMPDALLALYSVGKCACDLLQFVVSDAVAARACEESTLIRSTIANGSLPIDSVLGLQVDAPLQLPAEVLEMFPALPLANQRQYRIRSGDDGCTVNSHIKPADWVARIHATLENLSTKLQRITLCLISRALAISGGALKEIMSNHPEVSRKVRLALETPIEFAKRKIRLLASEMVKEGLNPSPFDVVKRANAHIYYSRLKQYAEHVVQSEISNVRKTIGL